MVDPKNPDAFKSIQPPIHREHYEPEPPQESVSFLKCTINELGTRCPYTQLLNHWKAPNGLAQTLAARSAAG